MRKHSVLVLGLLAAIVGCGSDDQGDLPAAGGTGSGGHAGSALAGAGGALAAAGNAGALVTGGSAGTGTGGSGGACDIPSLQVFNRSDTEQPWDDNDFSDVLLGSDPCPKLLDVTWPHEANWENADPSESNREVTHFTIDSYSSVDLAGKKLSLTIELTKDLRGPAA